VSTAGDVVALFAPGPYRDAHNAERFYLVFESWLTKRTTVLRGPGDVERVITPFTWYEERRSSGEVHLVERRSRATKSSATMATSRSLARAVAAKSKSKARMQCLHPVPGRGAGHGFAK